MERFYTTRPISIVRIVTPVILMAAAAVALCIASLHPNLLQADLTPFTIQNHNFVGNWYAHSSALTIQSDGKAYLEGRTHHWCADQPTPPCDTIDDNNTIIPGIKEDIVFDREEDNTLYGTITTSTDNTNGKPITIKWGPNDTLNVNGRTMCGPKSPVGYCGA